MKADDNKQKLINAYLVSVVVILGITAIGKLISSIGDAPILNELDVLFGVKNRFLMVLTAIFEIWLIVILLSSRSVVRKIGIVFYASLLFSLYRFARMVLHAPAECPCVGYFADNLPVSPVLVSSVGQIFFWYLVLGSLCGILWIRFFQEKEVV